MAWAVEVEAFGADRQAEYLIERPHCQGYCGKLHGEPVDYGHMHIGSDSPADLARNDRLEGR